MPTTNYFCDLLTRVRPTTNYFVIFQPGSAQVPSNLVNILLLKKINSKLLGQGLVVQTIFFLFYPSLTNQCALILIFCLSGLLAVWGYKLQYFHLSVCLTVWRDYFWLRTVFLKLQCVDVRPTPGLSPCVWWWRRAVEGTGHPAGTPAWHSVLGQVRREDREVDSGQWSSFSNFYCLEWLQRPALGRLN